MNSLSGFESNAASRSQKHLRIPKYLKGTKQFSARTLKRDLRGEEHLEKLPIFPSAHPHSLRKLSFGLILRVKTKLGQDFGKFPPSF
jgi:hypothetical protein